MSWWELLLTVIGLIAVAIVAIANFRKINIIPRPRATLRADLEILKLLEPNDENYQIVKATVDSSIRLIYQTLDRRTFRERFRVYDWFNLIFGIAVLGGLGWWTVNLINGGSWWAILTGFFALIGLFNMVNAFTEPRRGKNNAIQGD
jgi:hypothetical protein